MKNKIAIQMDDIKTIDFDFDSSFIIGLEGQRRNYDLFYYHPNDLFIDQGEVKAKGFFLELFDQKTNYFKFLSDKTEVKLEEFKFIFLRYIKILLQNLCMEMVVQALIEVKKIN